MSNKKTLIAMPPSLLEQVDFIAQSESRTRSDLIREALRRYIDSFRRNAPPLLSIVKTEKKDDTIAPQEVWDMFWKITKEQRAELVRRFDIAAPQEIEDEDYTHIWTRVYNAGRLNAFITSIRDMSCRQ